MHGRYRLPPPVQYPGGNSRLANFLQKYLPPHSTYVEPFVGGGSMFWRKDVAPTNALGDIQPDTIRLFAAIRDGSLAQCLCERTIRNTRELFERTKHKPRKSACDLFLLRSVSFRGNADSYLPSNNTVGGPIGSALCKRFDRYHRKVRTAHMGVSDFATTMQQFDSPTTLHYLDPPWPEADKDKRYYGEHTLDPRKVEGVARAMRGRVLIVYSPHQSVLGAFTDKRKWHVYKTKVSGASGHTSGSAPAYKLVIANWRLK